MSERKVLNKYYPPDFDPSKIPRVRQAKNKQFTVRLMAPFNMKCKTCGEYIYKGKKFNARKEDVENETYLGIRIYRFYIKCTRCLSEISFKTDPASTDYVVEAGATRNFMALKLAEEQAVREMEAEKEEERTNPMKLLENRTKASRGEIEMVETLEELKELNKRKVVVNFDDMLYRYDEARQTEAEVQENEDEQLIKSVFGERTEDGMIVKRLADDDGSKTRFSVYQHRRTYRAVYLIYILDRSKYVVNILYHIVISLNQTVIIDTVRACCVLYMKTLLTYSLSTVSSAHQVLSGGMIYSGSSSSSLTFPPLASISAMCSVE
uniref:Splicing factor YJU2 n=1 Tax=Ceriodaphnia reticulata TaxID=302197 RepID=A0A4Y7M0N2_9CRUS|nr:EOG090X0G3U [Ceriodaphnia reticulata]SVE73259.1 EOG090X0G3U [Ceriodaphnia reticulata]